MPSDSGQSTDGCTRETAMRATRFIRRQRLQPANSCTQVLRFEEVTSAVSLALIKRNWGKEKQSAQRSESRAIGLWITDLAEASQGALVSSCRTEPSLEEAAAMDGRKGKAGNRVAVDLVASVAPTTHTPAPKIQLQGRTLPCRRRVHLQSGSGEDRSLPACSSIRGIFQDFTTLGLICSASNHPILARRAR